MTEGYTPRLARRDQKTVVNGLQTLANNPDLDDASRRRVGAEVSNAVRRIVFLSTPYLQQELVKKLDDLPPEAGLVGGVIFMTMREKARKSRPVIE